MSEISQMDLINASIEYGAKGTDNKQITKNILAEWRGSSRIIDMKDAEEYYRVNNTEIAKKTRSYVDSNGNIVPNNTLANTKSKTAKYRNQINRKANFALNKPFVISCNNDNYKDAWDEFLNSNIRKVIARVGKQAINKGINWAYVWIDKEGNLQLIDTESETIYPAWTDIGHTKLDALVRDYVVIEYTNGEPREVYKVEFWDNTIFQRFIDYGNGEGSGDLEDDTFSEEESELDARTSVLYSHMQTPNGEGISWDRIPFIYFKGNEDELPALNECRSDIDNYDLIKSKGIDSILDDIDAVLVVEDIDPSMGTLVQARQTMQNSRIVTLEQGGKAYYLKVDLDINATKEQLDIIKKDLIEDTNDIDITTIEFGSNPSGKAMRMFFEPLNIWANGFESEFRIFMQQLKYFFDKWLSWKGGYGTFEELQNIDITFTLDRDLLTDESEIIQNIVQLGDELSQETKDELNPYVEDHEKEQQRREEDRKKALENQEMFGFVQDVDNETINIDENEENNENE